MGRYYITHIGASGPHVPYSSVTLNDGVNIIYGASNTGKSYVIACINFMFAGEPPFTRVSTGYDEIHLQMRSTEGYLFSASRKIVDGKDGDIGASSVKVESEDPNIPSATYKTGKYEYSDIILKLMGINEHHKIIADQAYGPNNLGIRQLIHYFYLEEDNIFEKSSALDTPKRSRTTPLLTCLKFMFDGDDLQDIIPEEVEEDRQRRIVEKNAVIGYINDKMLILQEKKEEILGLLEREDVDLETEANMGQIVDEIADLENRIQEATLQSKEYMAQIYELDEEIEEARFLQQRYMALQSQYNSDIRRLRFVSKGDVATRGTKKTVVCPFCNSNMGANEEQRLSYAAAAEVEIGKTKNLIEDLKTAEKELKADLQELEEKRAELVNLNKALIQLISKQLKPRAQELKRMLESYKRAVAYSKEIDALDFISVELNTDAFEKEAEEDGTKIEWDPKTCINKDKWKKWSDLFQAIVQECNYPGRPAARISLEYPYDAVVGKKRKKDEGKGFRAFLNTIMLFSLMKILETDGMYRFGLLILDSPILSLKERKYNITEKEKATASMREGLFSYMIKNCGENQIIIAENELPENVNYDNVNLIEFTMSEQVGRYGFLKEIVDTSSN